MSTSSDLPSGASRTAMNGAIGPSGTDSSTPPQPTTSPASPGVTQAVPPSAQATAPERAQSRTLTVTQRQAAGKRLTHDHTTIQPCRLGAASDRPDPIELLEAQAQTRISELVPIRYGRMLASPFAFLRGSAAGDGA